jgi:hypothetical protein
MARSRQQTEKQEKIYCRKCMTYKTALHFFTATDTFLDSNKLFSICKECVNEMYDNFLITEGSMEYAILKMCKILNVKYDEHAIESAKKQIDTKSDNGIENPSVFGNYKAKLLMVTRTKIGERSTCEDLTFTELTKDIVDALPQQNIKDQEYYESVWGKSTGLNQDDYEFLEQEYIRWAGQFGNITHAEETLIRDICHIQNEIRKCRINGEFKKVESLIEARQKIMKDGALTPALQNAANSGKNADCFGVWLRDIEQTTPAEWYDQQEKYKDMDGIQEDIQDIIRSDRNFITGSRDFGTMDLESINESDLADDDGSS